jgi:hypothetical protein
MSAQSVPPVSEAKCSIRALTSSTWSAEMQELVRTRKRNLRFGWASELLCGGERCSSRSWVLRAFSWGLG